MRASKQLAVSGMLAALQIVLMFLGSVIWVLCYCAPMFCGLIMIILKESVGTKHCFIVYAVCSIIGLLFLPDKECVLTYIFFFGYYTIIRGGFEKLPKALAVVLKLLLYNVSIAASQLILFYVFGVPFESDFGKWSIPVLLLSFNIVFVFYEMLLPRLTFIYHKKYKSRVDRLLK
ncbi:MAG: hypothetical protein IJR60_08850 [Eubacterium sp.]|nr:hypothetical protein [Eubacterium sp.]